MYVISTFEETPFWEKTQTAEIACFPWDESGYRPVSEAKLCYVKAKGLCVRMWSYEKNPRTVHHTTDDMVCEDSCLEFFMHPAGTPDKAYLNFEMNSAACLRCEYGIRRNRKFIRELGWEFPQAEPFRGEDERGTCWGVELTIPDRLMAQAFGSFHPVKGTVLKGNFYKCGDLTPAVHYGCWNPVGLPSADYHREDFFGDMVFE